MAQEEYVSGALVRDYVAGVLMNCGQGHRLNLTSQQRTVVDTPVGFRETGVRVGQRGRRTGGPGNTRRSRNNPPAFVPPPTDEPYVDDAFTTDLSSHDAPGWTSGYTQASQSSNWGTTTTQLSGPSRWSTQASGSSQHPHGDDDDDDDDDDDGDEDGDGVGDDAGDDDGDGNNGEDGGGGDGGDEGEDDGDGDRTPHQQSRSGWESGDRGKSPSGGGSWGGGDRDNSSRGWGSWGVVRGVSRLAGFGSRRKSKRENKGCPPNKFTPS